jgi:hypothetical protein
MGVARSQECTNELACISIEDHKRVIDVLLEVAVVATLFLITVSGIISSIEVQHNLLWGTILAALSDIQFG